MYQVRHSAVIYFVDSMISITVKKEDGSGVFVGLCVLQTTFTSP